MRTENYCNSSLPAVMDVPGIAALAATPSEAGSAHTSSLATFRRH